MSRPDYEIHYKEIPGDSETISRVGVEVRPPLDSSTFGTVLKKLVSGHDGAFLNDASVVRNDGLGTAIDCSKHTLMEARSMVALKASESPDAKAVAVMLAGIIDPVGLLSIQLVERERSPVTGSL